MSESSPISRTGKRDTRRKKQIRSALEGVYSGQSVLLDELRWTVRVADAKERGEKNCVMTRSWLNSFARTIREQLPQYRIHKIPLNDETPLGVVARAAVYRLKESNGLCRFLLGPRPCILCRWVTNIQAQEPRYRAGHAKPYHYAAMFRLFRSRPAKPSDAVVEQAPGVFIPGTHHLSLLARRDAIVDLKLVAKVPWNLFGYYKADEWYEVNTGGKLGHVKRNPDMYGRI